MNGGESVVRIVGGTVVSKFARGITITLIGAALWGFSGTCSQYLFQHYDIAPLLVTVIRMLGASAAFIVAICVTDREKLSAILHDAPTRRGLLIFGCLGLFLVQVTFVVTISLTNAGMATVLQALNIVFCMLIAFVTERRGPHATELLAFVAAFVATVLVATGGNLSGISISPAGLAWGIATALTATVYITYPKRMFARWGSFTITGLGMLVGGVTALAVWILSPALPVSLGTTLGAGSPLPAMGADGWIALGIFTFVGTFLAFGLYLHGISVVGSMRGSMLGTIEPVTSMVVSAAWLGTVFVPADWLGLVLMIATVFLVTMPAVNAEEEQETA